MFGKNSHNKQMQSDAAKSRAADLSVRQIIIMSSSNALPNLTRDNILGFGVVLLIAVTIIFTSLNTGTGNKTKVHGTVISIGINSSQPYKLPSRLITVQLNNGQVVTVKAKHTDHISKGDNVTLVKTDKALSSASEYELSSEQP